MRRRERPSNLGVHQHRERPAPVPLPDGHTRFGFRIGSNRWCSPHLHTLGARHAPQTTNEFGGSSIRQHRETQRIRVIPQWVPVLEYRLSTMVSLLDFLQCGAASRCQRKGWTRSEAPRVSTHQEPSALTA